MDNETLIKGKIIIQCSLINLRIETFGKESLKIFNVKQVFDFLRNEFAYFNLVILRFLDLIILWYIFFT